MDAARVTTGRAIPSSAVHTVRGAAAPRAAHSFNDPSREAGKEAAMTGSSAVFSDPPAAESTAPPLLSAPDVARVVDRIAHQLIERAGTSAPAPSASGPSASATSASAGDTEGAAAGLDDLVLMGIPTRGAPLARRLAAR